MGMLAWVMMGLAIWHFTIWLPDRFWGGIVGAFIASIIGSILVGLIIHGFSIPGTHTTHLITAIEGIPGAIIAMAITYAEGIRRENTTGPTAPQRMADPNRAGLGESRISAG